MNNNEPPETRALISGGSKYQYYDEIDLGDAECISPADILLDSWLVMRLDLDNIIDYFWEAEITEVFDTDLGWFTRCKDYFSELEDDNYSKYRCYKGDSGFNYCNKDNCEGCKHIGSKKVLNEQYILWQKYVQPIELDYS